MKDKVVFVTGGGRGIGAACGKIFSQAGAKVILTSRSTKELEKTAQECGAFAITADVSDEAQVKALFQKAKDKFGPVDILINNAGTIHVQNFSAFPTDQWDQIMAVNLKGPFLCSREAFIQMQASKKGGSIINISSLSGIRGTEKFPGFTPYTVSKHGMVGLTENLAVEGREWKIRVNCVAPGAVDTVMLKQAAPFLKTQTKPEDIARTVFFLASENSKPMTGAIIEIHSNGS